MFFSGKKKKKKNYFGPWTYNVTPFRRNEKGESLVFLHVTTKRRNDVKKILTVYNINRKNFKSSNTRINMVHDIILYTEFSFIPY